MSPRPTTTQPNYRGMAEFRYQIRRFLRFSERAARQFGVEPQQYQLMQAVKGIPPGERPRIGYIAERLQIQHHSTVELVDRLVKRSLVRRRRSDNDRREVLLELTSKGDRLLQELSIHHRAEYREIAPALVAALKRSLRDTEMGETEAATKKTRPKGTRAG